nr:hypothetical protein DM860_013539 [Ipomoea trifida]GMD50814.1 hypothetical protein DM860_013539 [Ipomoea batatas]GMD52846.1 hypothetical protein DM860_013539 [Ipomoea batatas]
METRKFQVKDLLKDKKFWFASILIAWAAGLQRQDSFKQKFGNVNNEGAENQ